MKHLRIYENSEINRENGYHVSWDQMLNNNYEAEFCQYLDELLYEFKSDISKERMEELFNKVIKITYK